jgi:hypothetical protein
MMRRRAMRWLPDASGATQGSDAAMTDARSRAEENVMRPSASGATSHVGRQLATVIRDDHVVLIVMAAVVGVASGAAAGALLAWIEAAIELFPRPAKRRLSASAPE